MNVVVYNTFIVAACTGVVMSAYFAYLFIIHRQFCTLDVRIRVDKENLLGSTNII
jgi:hypothetical protein